MCLEKAFIDEKRQRHLRSISRRRLAGVARRSGSGGAGWGCLCARRVSRAVSPPGVQQTSRPPQRGSGWEMPGQSCLRSAALQFLKLPGEGRGEQGRAAGSARRRFQNLSAPGAWLGGREPAPAAGTRGRAGTSALQRPPLCPHAHTGQGVFPPPDSPPGYQWHLGAIFLYIFNLFYFCFA